MGKSITPEGVWLVMRMVEFRRRSKRERFETPDMFPILGLLESLDSYRLKKQGEGYALDTGNMDLRSASSGDTSGVNGMRGNLHDVPHR